LERLYSVSTSSRFDSESLAIRFMPYCQPTTVTVYPEPTAVASNSGPVCYDVTSISVNETGGDAVSWAWTSDGSASFSDASAQNPTVTGFVDGEEFTVTITDVNGCTSTATTTVTVYALPTVDAGSYGPVCIDADDISLAGTPAGGVWTGTGVSGNATDGYVFAPSSGTQTLTYTYTDGNSCENSDQTIITVNPLPAVIAGFYGPVCADADDISLAGTPAGGVWTGTGVSGNQTDGYVFDPSEGTQTLTYTYTDENTCINSDQATIVVNETPVVTLSSTSDVTCFDNADGSINISVTGGTASYTYAWTKDGSTFATSEDLTGLAPGTYAVTVTDANGCTDELTGIVISQPDEVTLSVSATNVICNGEANGKISIDSYTGTGIPTFYISLNGGAFIERTITEIETTEYIAGTYTVKVEYPDGTGEGVCEATDEKTISEPEPLIYHLTIGLTYSH
jgi:hypothetical protein